MRRLLEIPDAKSPLGLRDRAILELFYSTGLRRSELATLSVYDVDLNAGVVRVRSGKGKKDRVVPLGKVAARWVSEYVRRIRPAFAREASDTHLFLTAAGRGISDALLAALANRCARRAEIEKKVSCHSLRHAFATHLHQEGAGIRAIQAMLGHESLESTQIYTRLVPQDLARGIERFHPLERVKSLSAAVDPAGEAGLGPASASLGPPRRRRRARRGRGG